MRGQRPNPTAVIDELGRAHFQRLAEEVPGQKASDQVERVVFSRHPQDVVKNDYLRCESNDRVESDPGKSRESPSVARLQQRMREQK